VKLAYGLRLIDAERVELGYLVQKAFLRRGRHHRTVVAEEDRLAQLPVPVAEGELLAAIGRDREVLALDVLLDLCRIAAVGARRGLADDAHGRPRRHVLRQHAPAHLLFEPVLDLGSAPLFARRMPG